METNWLDARASDLSGSVASAFLWGHVTLPASGALSETRFDLSSGSGGSVSLGTIDRCENGLVMLTGETGFFGVNSYGLGLVHFFANSTQDFVTLPRDAYVTKNTLNNHDYIGFLFEEGVGATAVLAKTTGFSTGRLETTSTPRGSAGSLGVAELGTDDRAGFLRLSLSTARDEESLVWGSTNTNLAASGRGFFYGQGYLTKSPTTSVSLVLLQN